MLTTSEPLFSPEQRAAENRGLGRQSAGEMRGVADTRVCFGVKLIQNATTCGESILYISPLN